MFNIGDLIIYGSTGVCRVDDIVTHSTTEKEPERMFYVLTPMHQDCTISAPVDSTKVFMRPIISREEAEALIDRIPTIHAEAYHSRVLRQLTEHYEEAIKTHDCETLVELTMSIYIKKRDMEKSKRKFGAVDQRFLKRAEDLLFGELGAALGISRDKVQEFISERINSAKIEE